MREKRARSSFPKQEQAESQKKGIIYKAPVLGILLTSFQLILSPESQS